ncbi:aminoglycoside phosphotransferase [Beutenbergia cavernae DSM 12333]|uniref:Aminoglycoside phosphotransferase n=1 Tax=Beutenbergia cavernae (strain ATCC BAA-8 / DSM 12333 / CCUG 43141 / JCM 11478 / NBRC 16432 / NCIMB 13614 / HKI 0122) TaxID=471853 RepID=C5BZ84_BEUC1|nr:phosphotransferase [Beutenbergia cavernae]ACQ81199.1 aminoglycoside phosphotransferase [Beutenbergia cavernae DSM 12333]
MTREVEVRLPGGNVGGAVRVGDTVRRPTGPWTPAVHALLDHLASRGLRAVPRTHGYDHAGREVLDYLPGEVIDVDSEVLTNARLASAARWLRDYHAAVGDFRPGTLRWRFGTLPLDDGEIVCHHDVAPYNMAFDCDELAGVFDWDVAGPGRPIDDLGFLAWNGVPLFREVPGWTADDVAARLRLLAGAYGDGPSPLAIAEHAVARMRAATDRIEAGQRAGDPGMLRLGEIGEPAATRARIAAFATRLPAVAAALR